MLEFVDGTPLWQIGELETWQAAARWLARLHALPVPTDEWLLRYDETQLEERLRLAPGTERFAAHVAERLAALPARLIHGDFYPANILVEGAGGSASSTGRRAASAPPCSISRPSCPAAGASENGN